MSIASFDDTFNGFDRFIYGWLDKLNYRRINSWHDIQCNFKICI